MSLRYFVQFVQEKILVFILVLLLYLLKFLFFLGIFDLSQIAQSESFSFVSLISETQLKFNIYELRKNLHDLHKKNLPRNSLGNLYCYCVVRIFIGLVIGWFLPLSIQYRTGNYQTQLSGPPIYRPRGQRWTVLTYKIYYYVLGRLRRSHKWRYIDPE